jgi:hypothetical protein
MALYFPLQGTYSQQLGVPDVGTGYQFSATGRSGRLGLVSATGSLQSTGSIAQGHATGTLQIPTSHGTLIYDLTGPTQPGFSSLPSVFSYTLSGTGRLQGVGGSGTATVTLVPSNSSNGQGQITITLRAGASTWVV